MRAIETLTVGPLSSGEEVVSSRTHPETPLGGEPTGLSNTHPRPRDTQYDPSVGKSYLSAEKWTQEAVVEWYPETKIRVDQRRGWGREEVGGYESLRVDWNREMSTFRGHGRHVSGLGNWVGTDGDRS